MDNIVSLASYYGEINQLKRGEICRPRMMIFYPTYVCNQQCYYCFCKQYRSSETMPMGKILDLLKEAYDYGVRGVEYCVLPHQKVRLKECLKNIQDVVVGDDILTEKGNFEKVKDVIVRDYDGDVIEIKTGADNRAIQITPDHKVLVWRSKQCKFEKRWKNRCKPNCSRKRKKDCSFEFDEINPVWMKAKDLTPLDFVVYPKIKQENNKEYSDEEIELFGYYISEGCLEGNGKGVKFSLHINETDFAERLKVLIKNICLKDITERVEVEKKVRYISFYNKEIAQKLKRMFGFNAVHKKIPMDIYGLNKKQLEVLLKAMIRGDGWFDGKSFGYSTGSEILATQMKELLFLMGRNNYYFERYREPHWKISVNTWEYLIRYNNGKSQEVFENDDFCFIPIKKIIKKQYQGKVYNLNIENTHSYVVHSAIISNCGGGEPLCHPDIAEIFTEAKKIGLSLGLLTNGVNFSDEIMNAFISAGNYVRISIETIDPMLYRMIRGTDDCQKVLDNIDDALGYKELIKSKCQISVKVGVGKDLSMENIQQLVDYFSQREITSLQIKHLWDEKGYYYNPLIKAISLDNVKKHEVNVIKKIPQKKININKKCWLNPLQVTIDAKGDVQLCCYYMNRKGHCFGNVYQNTFKDIWECEEHLAAMSQINSVDCQKHDCRFIKYMRTADYLYKCKDWNFI